MKKIVITGGAGFIGSQIVERFVDSNPDAKIVVLDKMTYAADVRNILHLMTDRRIELKVGDICDLQTCMRVMEDADLVIHAAAESHVDNSFGNSFEFTKTNVAGTHSVMEACRLARVPKIIHVSTDEVYGEVPSGAADEDTVLKPTNPYSASKAAAEMIVNGYRQSFKIPLIVVRANNIFGIRQFPEKIIPKFIISLLMGHKVTIHGNGNNKRHFLSAHDFAGALELLVKKGEIGGCYNIGTTEEYKNIEIARMICGVFGLDPEQHITFVTDRPFNDARYAVDWGKIKALGWKPHRTLHAELPSIVQWYIENIERYEKTPVRIVNDPRQMA
jgi:dTDP-glucose 4,6-dehydratase